MEFRGSPERLAALRTGGPVDYGFYDLPPWAWEGLDRRGLRRVRAVVDGAGRISVREETTEEWAVDAGMW